MRFILSVLILFASVLASFGAVNYPARTNGNNTFYGTNNHVGPVIMGNTNWMANGGSRINKVFFTNGNVYASGDLYASNAAYSQLFGNSSGGNAGFFFLGNGLFIGDDPGTSVIDVGSSQAGKVQFYTDTIVPTGTSTAQNFIHSSWKWVDILTSGDAVAFLPTGDPPELLQWGGSNYLGYAYFYDSAAAGDKSYFTLQSAHKIAATNAANPNVWVEPHIHVTTTNFTAGTNATFRLDLYYGSVWGYLTNWYAKTNTVSMTNLYQHCVLSFGNLTNNSIFSGRSSVLFKGRIMRIDGGTGDIGANPVWVDSIDVHIPVTELGSTGQTGD